MQYLVDAGIWGRIELVEVTPTQLRLRKKVLDAAARGRAAKRARQGR